MAKKPPKKEISKAHAQVIERLKKKDAKLAQTTDVLRAAQKEITLLRKGFLLLRKDFLKQEKEISSLKDDLDSYIELTGEQEKVIEEMDEEIDGWAERAETAEEEVQAWNDGLAALKRKYSRA